MCVTKLHVYNPCEFWIIPNVETFGQFKKGNSARHLAPHLLHYYLDASLAYTQGTRHMLTVSIYFSLNSFRWNDWNVCALLSQNWSLLDYSLTEPQIIPNFLGIACLATLHKIAHLYLIVQILECWWKPISLYIVLDIFIYHKVVS